MFYPDNNRSHPVDLLTDEIKARLPKLGATEHDADPIAQVKFFHPASSYTAFATEYDGEDTFFGWVMALPGCGELGYFSLSEMQSVEVFGLGIERDINFQPMPLSQATVDYQ